MRKLATELRATAADAVLTGTTRADKIEINADTGFHLRMHRISGTQFDIGTVNPVSGGNLNIKNSNGTDARVVVYSDLFWCRALGGINGNGKAKFDGDVEMAAKLDISGDVAFDTDGLFFQQSSNRLGLGTTTPGGALHIHHPTVNAIFQREGGSSKVVIKPNASDDGMTIQGAVNSGNSLILETLGALGAVKVSNNEAGTIASFGAAITLSKNTSVAGELTAAADVAFDTDGLFFKQSNRRLGLGTTTPGGALHAVHGSVNAIFQRANGSSKLLIKPNTTDDGMTIQGQSNSANSIVLDTVGGSAAVKFTNNDHGTLATIGSTIALNKNTAITGDLDISDDLDISNDGGYFLRLNRNTSTQLDIITGNIPSGGNLNLKNSNGTDAKVVVLSDLFWCRNLGGSSGNGTAKFDGDITAGSEIKMTNNYADKATAGTGALGDIAVIGGALCFHDGSDWKTITLGSAPS